MTPATASQTPQLQRLLFLLQHVPLPEHLPQSFRAGFATKDHLFVLRKESTLDPLQLTTMVPTIRHEVKNVTGAYWVISASNALIPDRVAVYSLAV